MRTREVPVGHPSSNCSRPSTLNPEFLSDELPEKKVYLIDMSILSILLSPRPGCHTLTPLEDRRPHQSTPVQELPLLDTSMHPVPAHVPGPHVCAPDPHTPMLPQGSALIPNVTPRPLPGRGCYPWQLSRISRLAPQINTSLLCAICPHSCALGNNFPVSHPSSNRSRPLDELPEKKAYLVDMSILSILLSPRPECHSYDIIMTKYNCIE
jgi:hypothetical protein